MRDRIKRWLLGRVLRSAYMRHWLAWCRFQREFAQFRALSEAWPARFALRWEDRYPCLYDKTGVTGFDRHYIYHTAWAARIVAQLRPAYHVDISSSLYFSALVSAFVPVVFFDCRPTRLFLSHLSSGGGDLTALPFADGSITSLSCMHVVEHVGLGRYGDALDPDGDLKAIAELRRVLAPGGSLLFVVPVGQPVIMFNAHRIYAYEQIMDYFNGLLLRQFALVPDDPHYGLIEDATPQLADVQRYGCGCFWWQNNRK